MRRGDLIGVLCVDDNILISLATQEIIDATPDMSCVGCLYDAEGLVEAVTRLRPDAVLMDLSMPGKDPLVAIRELAVMHPEVSIVVFSGYSDLEKSRKVLDAGARRYVTKSCDSNAMLEAIRSSLSDMAAAGSSAA